MSGPVKMVSSDSQTGQIFVEESFIVLLDNYRRFLLFLCTRKGSVTILLTHCLLSSIISAICR